MNEIREQTSKFCLNVSSDPRLLQETIRQSFKDLCSLSKQMKSLADYGPILMSKKLFEPVSPGASSPCHSDNCLDDDEEKSRVVEPTLYEVAEIFLDTSAIIEISQSAQNSNWCLWIMLCGLHDESALKGLLALVEKHVQNVQFETCKKVVYKGQTSFVLHFKEHFTTQKVFTFLKEDFYAKTYIKDRWQIIRFYNRMDDPKYMSQFFGIILQNLPLDCTSQTIIDLVSMHSSNISVLSVEIPTLVGDSFCSLIRTKTLEDAEMLALTLNGLITQTGSIRAGLHPSCNFKHQNFEKDPFKDIKVDHHPHPQNSKAQVETEKEKKNDIKALLSLFKSELKTSRPPPAAVEIQKISEEPRMIPPRQPFAPQRQFPPHFFEPMPGPSFAFNGPPPSFQNHPRNPAMFYGPQKWVPPNYRPDYYHPTAEFLHQQNAQIQKFGKKIKKTILRSTRASNHQNTPVHKITSRKGQPPKTSNSETLAESRSSPQKASPVQEESKKEVRSPSSSHNNKRSFVESVQSGNKQNLDKVFEKKLAGWNLGVYQVKLTGEKIINKSNSVNVSNWKITCGTSSNEKVSNNNQLPFYLENMMDQMVNPSKPKKPSRFSDKREGEGGPSSVNKKRKFESLYPENDKIRPELVDNSNKIQKLKTNIQEFQKKSDEIEDQNRLQRFKKSKNKSDALLSSSSDEEKELDLGPQKKQYLETLTAEIPHYGGNFKPKVEKEGKAQENKINLDSLGWSIKCQTKKNILPENKQELSPETAQKPNLSTTTPSEAAGPTNIVFNGSYVQSSNLNYMYMPPGMAYPHLLMNMNHHQPPVTPNSFSFNPQLMVYHNNFILNPLVPYHNQPPFWNVPMSNAPHQESAKNPLQTKSPKKFKNWIPRESPSAKNKSTEECPEPESPPPVLPDESSQDNQERD